MFNIGDNYIAKAHRGGANFDAQHFELARDDSGFLTETLILGQCQHVLVGGNGRDDAHQVRFTGAVVAHQQDAFVVDDVFQLQLGENLCADELGHVVAHDIALNKFLRLLPVVCAAQNDDGFNGVKLNQVTVFHGDSLLQSIMM